jgi:hypothetical protein
MVKYQSILTRFLLRKTLNILKMDDKKIILDKYPSYSGESEFIEVIFLMNFVRALN